jgi:hypothetical protein
MSTIWPARPRSEGQGQSRPGARHGDRVLGRYRAVDGRERELVLCPGAADSLLVIDRLAVTLADQRLVAHLAADEPPQNAQIACSLYLADERGRRCRRVSPEDFTADPVAPAPTCSITAIAETMASCESLLIDGRGCRYRLEAVRGGTATPELRWRRHPPRHGCPKPVSVRQVIGSLESYEPARSLSAQAVAAFDRDETLSVAALRNGSPASTPAASCSTAGCARPCSPPSRNAASA